MPRSSGGWLFSPPAGAACWHNGLAQRVFKSQPQTAQLPAKQQNLDQSFLKWLQSMFGWVFPNGNGAKSTLGMAYMYDEQGNALDSVLAYHASLITRIARAIGRRYMKRFIGGGRALVVALGTFVLALGAAHAQIYKCTQGANAVFTDKPCAEGNAVTLKTPVGIPQSDIQFEAMTTHYPVAGANYAQVYRRLITQTGVFAGGFAGWAKWDVDYSFDTRPRTEGCSVDRVHIKIRGQIMMPKWETLTDAPPSDQSRWDSMYAQLKRHEEGHVQHGREFALLLREKLLGIGTVPCDRIRAATGQVYRTLYTNLQDRDAEYDRRTQHGLALE
jgi:predicted secreted Zn-dependent protease